MSAILEPSRRHRAVGGRQVVPGGTNFHPPSGHDAGLRAQVIPVHTGEQPAAGLRPGSRVVIPLPTVEHPAGTHVARSIETVHVPVDDDGLSRGVGAVLVSVPPASSIALPCAHLVRRGRSADVDRGARRYERGLRRVIDGHRRVPCAHRRHRTILTNRGHGLVRRGPRHIGHARIRGFVGGAQRHALPDG